MKLSPPWLILATCILMEVLGGVSYAFSVYSPLLKHNFAALRASQSKLDLIGMMNNLGGNIGVHTGIFYDARGAPWTVVVAGVLGVLGWGLMWATLRLDWSLGWGWLLPFSVLQGQAQLWVDVVSVMTALKAFPHHRGTVLGIVKGFVGLSGSIFTQFYVGLFRPNVLDFLLFNTVVVPAVCAIGAAAFAWAAGSAEGAAASAPRGRDTARSMLRVQHMVCLLIFYQLVAALVEQRDIRVSQAETGGGENSAAGTDWLGVGLTVGTVLLLVGLLALTITRRPGRARLETSSSDAMEVRASEEERSELLRGGEAKSAPESTADASWGGDVTLCESLRRAEFWLLFLVYFLGGGAGLVLINNLGQIAPTLGMAPGSEDTFVSLVSCSNAFGRIAAGALSDTVLQRGMPRPVVVLGAMLLMVVTHGLLAFSSAILLYPASVLCGLSYGAINAVFPTVLSEVFGIEHLGAIYATNSIALALG
eukprot:g7730.t1